MSFAKAQLSELCQKCLGVEGCYRTCCACGAAALNCFQQKFVPLYPNVKFGLHNFTLCRFRHEREQCSDQRSEDTDGSLARFLSVNEFDRFKDEYTKDAIASEGSRRESSGY